MTLRRFKRMLKERKDLRIRDLRISDLFGPVVQFSFAQELFASEIAAHGVKA